MLFQFEAISSLAKCHQIFKTLKPKKSHPIVSIHFLSIWANNVKGAYNCTFLRRFVFFWLPQSMRVPQSTRLLKSTRGIPLMDFGCPNGLHLHTSEKGREGFGHELRHPPHGLRHPRALQQSQSMNSGTLFVDSSTLLMDSGCRRFP